MATHAGRRQAEVPEKMSRTYTLTALADLVGGSVRGHAVVVISGVADVVEAGPNDATWVSRSGYASKLAGSRAGAVLVPLDFGPTPMPAVLCDRLDRSVAKLLGAFAGPVSCPKPGVDSRAIVHETARIGPDPAIGPCVVIDADALIGDCAVIHAGVFIGQGTTIGDHCVIWPHVVIRDGCVVGHRVIIHPNAVIGSDGLGFYFDEGEHRKIPHIGGVILGDDVEIGACSCIDRSKFGYTVVGRGTKIDNLVHVAHNVLVGEHCVLAGQVGISGSVRIGDYCIFGGNAGATDNLTIGKGVRLGGLAVATHDIPDGLTVSGFPAQDHRKELRERASLRRLPALAKQFKDLLARVERLEATANHSQRR